MELWFSSYITESYALKYSIKLEGREYAPLDKELVLQIYEDYKQRAKKPKSLFRLRYFTTIIKEITEIELEEEWDKRELMVATLECLSRQQERGVKPQTPLPLFYPLTSHLKMGLK